MIGFLLKKTMYDLWDNMFRIVVLNLGFIAVFAVPIFLPRLAVRFTDSQLLTMALSAFGILLCSVYLAAAAFSVKSLSDYGFFGFMDFFGNIKKAWPAGLVMGAFVFILLLVVTVVIPFYASIESPVGLLLAAVVFWTSIFCLLSFQFYFSVCVRLGPNLIKTFRKCMIISLDNSGLSIFLLLHNIAALILSIIFAFLFPGPAGILLYIDEALRLRLLKYDWLEANPGANRKKIPWDELLIEERDKTGDRTFKNFIFPWKD
ncbi:MAG: hypothetical protein LBH16_04240 [Treponema sp.]|jgi:hypothetical protein|nr:hypothetical protein [Treponema sp.]